MKEDKAHDIETAPVFDEVIDALLDRERDVGPIMRISAAQMLRAQHARIQAYEVLLSEASKEPA